MSQKSLPLLEKAAQQTGPLSTFDEPEASTVSCEKTACIDTIKKCDEMMAVWAAVGQWKDLTYLEKIKIAEIANSLVDPGSNWDEQIFLLKTNNAYIPPAILGVNAMVTQQLFFKDPGFMDYFNRLVAGKHPENELLFSDMELGEKLFQAIADFRAKSS